MAPRAEVNARLNRERELNDQDLQKIAAEYSERYRRTAVRYSGDMNEIPQRLLMPSVHDANLWQVRVKVRNSGAMSSFCVLKDANTAWKRTRPCVQSHAQSH